MGQALLPTAAFQAALTAPPHRATIFSPLLPETPPPPNNPLNKKDLNERDVRTKFITPHSSPQPVPAGVLEAFRNYPVDPVPRSCRTDALLAWHKFANAP